MAAMSPTDASANFVPLPTDDSFVPALATVLTHLVSLTPPNANDGISRFAGFRGVVPPNITVRKYLTRIARYFRCSNECFVLSLVYIDRIVKLHDGFVVSILNIHRLLITSVMLAAKFFDDVYYSNTFYARVGGVGTHEINVLESQFLSLINYQLFVSPEEYDQYRHNVQAAVQSSTAIRAANPTLSMQIPQEPTPPALPQTYTSPPVSRVPAVGSATRHFQSASKHGTSPKANPHSQVLLQQPSSVPHFQPTLAYAPNQQLLHTLSTQPSLAMQPQLYVQQPSHPPNSISATQYKQVVCGTRQPPLGLSQPSRALHPQHVPSAKASVHAAQPYRMFPSQPLHPLQQSSTTSPQHYPSAVVLQQPSSTRVLVQPPNQSAFHVLQQQATRSGMNSDSCASSLSPNGDNLNYSAVSVFGTNYIMELNAKASTIKREDDIWYQHRV